MKEIINFIKKTVLGWYKDGAISYSAALSFYVVLFLPAFLLMAVSIGGVILEQSTIQEQILLYVSQATGIQDLSLIRGLIQESINFDTRISTWISFIFLFATSSALFAYLQEALNNMWGIKPKHEGRIKSLVLKRVLSFFILLILGLSFIATLLLDVILSFGFSFFAAYIPYSAGLISIINNILGAVLTFLIFIGMLKMLPEAKISYKDAGVGALITTVLFLIGKNVIAWYIAQSSLTSAYGAAGSLVVLLLWVYYSSLILFLGVEATQVYAEDYGSKIKPKS